MVFSEEKRTKLKSAFKKIRKLPAPVILFVIIIIVTVRLIFLYSLRDGHHVDETWSYGFANSYYFPYVYEDNIGKWISGDTFKSYICVSEDQRFSFDSVMYNKSRDLSPVLYAILLHFISSLFPGRFSWMFAFSINLICYIPTLILVYLIAQDFTKSRICGYLSVIYYAISGCGTANFLYLRVYHLLTLFTLILFYLFMRILKYDNKNKWSMIFLLPIVSILGSLTHYYFLVIAFFLTFFSCIVLLIQKRYRDFLILGFVMLFSVVLFFCVYSPALKMLLPYFLKSSEGEATIGYYTYPYSWDLSIAARHFFVGTMGGWIDFTLIDLLSSFGIMFFVMSIFALIIFLFRNESWMKKVLSFVGIYSVKIFSVIFKFFMTFDIGIAVAFISTILYLFVIPYSATIYGMGYVERYFFPAMSLYCIIFSSVIFQIIYRLKSKFSKKISLVIYAFSFFMLAFLSYRSNMLVGGFRFSGMGDADLNEQLNGKDCYVYINGERDMVWLSSILCDANSIFVDGTEMASDYGYSFPDLDDKCYLLINTAGFLDEEQYQNSMLGNSLVLEMNTDPRELRMVDDLVNEIEENTGNRYVFLDEYPTFIGSLRLYKPMN